MESFREFVAVLFFIMGSMLIVFLFANAFSWANLLIGLSAYVASYFIWPSKRRGKRDNDSPVLDIIELVIEFPVELVVWFFRIIGRVLSSIFGGKGDGFDIDL